VSKVPQNKADLLKALRESKRFTKSELARQSGLSLSTINRLEKEPEEWNGVNHRTVEKIGSVLGVGKDYFLLDSDEPTEDSSSANSRTKATKVSPELVSFFSQMGFVPSSTSNTALKLTQPIKVDDSAPRRAHLQEPWDEQGKCLLERVRKVYLSWSDGDQQDRGSLQNMLYDEVDTWADQHGVERDDSQDIAIHGDDPDADDPSNGDPSSAAIITPDTVLYEEYNDLTKWGGVRMQKEGFAGKLINPGSEIKTAKAYVEIDGDFYDRIQAGRKSFYVPCTHGNQSNDVSQHEWVWGADDAGSADQKPDSKPKKRWIMDFLV
jgi:transcriptional regulator with XRE-family HTH domain